MIYIGIDPGVSGGIGVINHTNVLDPLPNTNIVSASNSTTVEAFKMPETEMDIVELLNQVVQGRRDEPGNRMGCFAYLEKAQAFPGRKKLITCPTCRTVMKTTQAQGVVSTGKFMQQYGTLKGILTALHIPFELIRPIDWQKGMGCLTKGDKNISKAACQRLFPDIKATHAISDSLLIAEFCRRMRNQGVSFSKTTIPVVHKAADRPIEG